MKVCLVILDGWGFNPKDDKYDAINTSDCKNMRYLSKNYPSFLIHASGEHVGLHENSMGNSEVGHLTIGSGRIIDQYITKIDKSIKDNTIKENLQSVSDLASDSIHLVIMISDGGIHSHIDHLFGVLDVLKSKFKQIYIHCITDGRDTAPNVAMKYINKVLSYCESNSICKIVTIAGRYYAMDRDNNTSRTEEYFNTLTERGNLEENIEEYIQKLYNNNCNDETIKPFRVSSEGIIEKSDKILFLNFRSDRMRQIVKRFVKNENQIFTLVEYEKDLPVQIIFKKETVVNTLPEVLSRNGISHTHIAESEKYAHVTYFFNGGSEKKLDLERRIIIESPKVSSFDKRPEMACEGISETILKELESGTPFIVSNFAAPDMVGHTGNFQATQKAIKKVDDCIGKIYQSCRTKGYVLIITADHGNAEVMFDVEKNIISKKHTSNKVPLIICTEKIVEKDGVWGYFKESEYSLRDVAPTILHLFGIEKPKEMSGSSAL